MHAIGSTIWLQNIYLLWETKFGYRTSTCHGKQKHSLVTEHLPAMGAVWLNSIDLPIIGSTLWLKEHLPTIGSTIWLQNICTPWEAQFNYRTYAWHWMHNLVTEHLPVIWSTIWLQNICLSYETQFGYRTSTYCGKHNLVNKHLPNMGAVWLHFIYLVRESLFHI